MRSRCRAVVLVLSAIATLSPRLAADCIRNGRPDLEDIAMARSEDCIGDSVPDECEIEPLSLAAVAESIPGRPTRALAIGNLDGNGAPDVVTGFSDTLDRRLTVFRNLHGRRFEPTAYDLESRPDAVACHWNREPPAPDSAPIVS